MRVKALRGFCIATGRDVAEGEVFEITDEWNARRLVGMGYVVPVGDAPAAPPEAERRANTPAAGQLTDREPEPEHREPRTRRKEG